MSDRYYDSCKEFEICNELIEKYFKTKQYKKCFDGHLALAEKGYPLAECQIGYFYYHGLGVEKDFQKAFDWTFKAATHGDRDAQYNLAEFYENGIGTEQNKEKSHKWYISAALQDQKSAIEKCKELGIVINEQ